MEPSLRLLSLLLRSPASGSSSSSRPSLQNEDQMRIPRDAAPGCQCPAASVASSRCGRAQIVAAGYESTQCAMTTRLSSLEGYPSLPLYAILCTLLLEYRRDLRPEPREHVARESGACTRSSNHKCALGPCGVRCVFRHICAGSAIGAFAIDYVYEA